MAGNKCELLSEEDNDEMELREIHEMLNLPAFFTSARSGMNVDGVFRGLAFSILGGNMEFKLPSFTIDNYTETTNTVKLGSFYDPIRRK